MNLRYAFQDDENCFFVLDLMLGGDLRCTSIDIASKRGPSIDGDYSSFRKKGPHGGECGQVLDGRAIVWVRVSSSSTDNTPVCFLTFAICTRIPICFTETLNQTTFCWMCMGMLISRISMSPYTTQIVDFTPALLEVWHTWLLKS